MENNKGDLLDSETDGFTTPTHNADRKITDFNHRRGFKRCEIADRPLFISTPLSRGMITLRKINLVKVFCDELLLGEILEHCLTFKDKMRGTAGMSDSESAICLSSKNEITDLGEDEDPKDYLQNQLGDCELVTNMASLSASKEVPIFEPSSKPDSCTDDSGRVLPGSFIQISPLKRKNAEVTLYVKPHDSVESSRSINSKKKKVTLKKQKVVSLKKRNNLTLAVSDLPQMNIAVTESVSSTGVSDWANENINNKSNDCTDPPGQLPVISVFKIPTVPVKSKIVDREIPQDADPKLGAKVQCSLENISMSSFNDCSFSPVQYQLPPESPQETVRPTEIMQCGNSEMYGKAPVPIAELIPSQNNCKSERNKRKIKVVKASVADTRNIEKPSKGKCIVETGEVKKTRSVLKHSTQKCHVEEYSKDCADSTSQKDISDVVNSHKVSNRIKGFRKECVDSTKHMDISDVDKSCKMNRRIKEHRVCADNTKHVDISDVVKSCKVSSSIKERKECADSSSQMDISDVKSSKVSSRIKECKECAVDSSQMDISDVVKSSKVSRRIKEHKKCVNSSSQMDISDVVKSSKVSSRIKEHKKCVNSSSQMDISDVVKSSKVSSRIKERKECADSSSQMDISDVVKSSKVSSRIKEHKKCVNSSSQMDISDVVKSSKVSSRIKECKECADSSSQMNISDVVKSSKVSSRIKEHKKCVNSSSQMDISDVVKSSKVSSRIKERKECENSSSQMDISDVVKSSKVSSRIKERKDCTDSSSQMDISGVVKSSKVSSRIKEHKNCADSSSQMDEVKSHKINSRIKATGKSEEREKMNLSEIACDKVLACNNVADVYTHKHMLAEDTTMNMSYGEIQCFVGSSCETLTDKTHGKLLTRKRHGIKKNLALNDVMKENNVASHKSQITEKLPKQGTIEQSIVFMANSSDVSVPNETLAPNSQSDENLSNSVLLQSKRALNEARVTSLRSRSSLPRPTLSKSQKPNRASFSTLNIEDKRPNSELCQRQELEKCVPSEDKKQAEIRLHSNRQSSLSDSSYRNRSKKATSVDILKQREIVLNATENLKINMLQEVCGISVRGGLLDQVNLQVVNNSSGVKMPERQLRKRKVNITLTENVNDETLETSLPTSTHAKVVKQKKRATKVIAESVQRERAQTQGKIKTQTAKKSSCPEAAADNGRASKVQQEKIRRKNSGAVTYAIPDEERLKQDKVPAFKKSTKLKTAAQPKSSEVTRSHAKQASQKFVGAHCSIAGGISNAVFEAVSIGARAFALFVRNGRTWKLNPLNVAEAEKFKSACEENGFLPRHILPHGSYLLNCGSSDVDILQKSRNTLVHELQICEMLGLEMYNFHPGSACGKGTVDECLMTVAESINLAHEKTKSVKTVIENMSCQGQTVGGKFEELKAIIDNVKDKSRVGVCLDTCHAFAAGFDLSSEEGFNKFMESFDQIVGLHYLCAMHLNDSKGELGCHLDRHENIGKGHIGLEGFRCLMNDPRLDNIPMVLETPVGAYAKEIKILYDLETV